MHLRFGPIEVNTQGLSRPLVVNVSGPHVEGGRVFVRIALESTKRAAVEKWAARLGVPVVELPALGAAVAIDCAWVAHRVCRRPVPRSRCVYGA
jgi:hypothetical protein